MIDRVKLLKAHEFCRANASCVGCPYDEECNTRDDAIEEDTIAFLREQEPVKPIPTGIEPNYKCGACKLPIIQGYPFCQWCGKPVKWDD